MEGGVEGGIGMGALRLGVDEIAHASSGLCRVQVAWALGAVGRRQAEMHVVLRQ